MAIGALGVYSTPGQDDPEYLKSRQKAFSLIQQQKFVEALPLLERLSIEKTDDAQVFFYLGFAFMGKANVVQVPTEKQALRVQARKAFVKAKELGFSDPLVDNLIQSLPPDGSGGSTPISSNREAEKFLREGEAHYSTGKLDDALKAYEKALKLDPKLYEAALFSGDVYVAQSKFDRAEEYYQRAISIDPNRETAYRYSATPLMKQKKFDQARERYIEAYITEPYNRFASAGLSQWADVTGTPIGHPAIEIPDKIEVDNAGNVKMELSPDARLGGRDNGTFYWSLYAPVRTKWRKEAFRKTFPNQTVYRHSLTEETEAIRAVLAVVRTEKSITKLDASLERLVKLDDQGLLEAYILLSRPTDGIAEDHAGYLKANRDKLRRYVKEHMIGTASNSDSAKSSDGEGTTAKNLVERTYDAAEDRTTVSIGFAPITCVKGVEGAACIFYSIQTRFPGEKAPEKLDRVTFALILLTGATKTDTPPALSVNIDGKVFDLGPMQFAGEESKDGLRALIYATTLNEGEMAVLGTAKKVEMKLGSMQFALPEATVRQLGEFYTVARSSR